MSKPKPPFKCLYDNDTTNLVRCLDPRFQRQVDSETTQKPLGQREIGHEFNDAMLEASIDEAARPGVDAQKLSPGHSWVAWWKSKYAPAEEHYRWFEETYGQKPDAYGQYMLAGGDMVATFVRRCREQNIAPFISFRTNQVQAIKESARQLNWNRWMEENHERIALNEPGTSRKEQRRLNWMLPEVRQHFLNFAEELCGYDIDGFEVDFTRHATLFRQDQTTRLQREDVITAFMAEIRHFLDTGAHDGRHRWLGVKIPCHLPEYPMTGLDLPRLVEEAGVDFVNLSPSYYCQQQTDIAKVRRLLPDTALYLDMTDNIQTGEGTEHDCKRRTTPEQFYTAAHLAYARGAEGVSFFNFRYYTQWDGYTEGSGCHSEPPFEILDHIHDPEWLSRQPQHWFLTRGYGGYHPSQAGGGKMMQNARENPQSPFPLIIEAGQRVQFVLDMAPPASGWRQDGRCRIQSPSPLEARQFRLKLNGEELNPCSDVSRPYDQPYPNPLEGKPEDYRAWTVPAKLLIDGENVFEISMTEGEPAELFYLDVAMK